MKVVLTDVWSSFINDRDSKLMAYTSQQRKKVLQMA